MSVRIEFWSAVAVTVPVLSLPLVITAREDFATWTRSISIWLRLSATFLYSIILIFAAVAEYFSFSGLADRPTPSWAPTFCLNVIMSLVGVVILSVVYQVWLRAPAEIWARVRIRNPRRGLRFLRSQLKTSRLESRSKRVGALAATRIEELSKAIKELDDVKAMIRDDSGAQRATSYPIDAAKMIGEHRAELSANKELLTRDLSALTLNREEMAELRNELIRVGDEATKRMRDAYANSLLPPS